MLGEGFLRRLAALECADFGRRLFSLLGPNPVLGGILDALAKLHFQLVEQLGAALRAATILVTLEQGDLELEPRDHGLGRRDHRARPCQIGFSDRGTLLRGGECRAQFIAF